MINNYLKNFCLICFALFGPIYLPAGGVQRNLNDNSLFNKSKEIVLNSNHSIYCMPEINAKKIRLLKTGTSIVVLRKWTDSKDDSWLRVQLAQSNILDNLSQPQKGWIKI
tara:strand:- start:243 stop:572 length:330 start_codon:yes stop_codon:yes gene_type:complete